MGLLGIQVVSISAVSAEANRETAGSFGLGFRGWRALGFRDLGV